MKFSFSGQVIGISSSRSYIPVHIWGDVWTFAGNSADVWNHLADVVMVDGRDRADGLNSVPEYKAVPDEVHLSVAPVFRAVGILALCFVAILWPVFHSKNWSLTTSGVVALLTLSGTSLISYFAFGLRDVQARVMAGLRRRFTAA